MNEEYKMLREEIMESISKQETLCHIVFTLLGASSIFSMINENINFIILIEFASAVLLARILHYRNAVCYLSTYLARLESFSNQCDFKWESRFREFNELFPKKFVGRKFKHKLIGKINKFSRDVKHLGNLALSSYLFLLLASILYEEICKNYLTAGYYFTLHTSTLCILGIISFLLNIVFSIAICFSYLIKPVYAATWEDVVTQPSNKKS